VNKSKQILNSEGSPGSGSASNQNEKWDQDRHHYTAFMEKAVILVENYPGLLYDFKSGGFKMKYVCAKQCLGSR